MTEIEPWAASLLNPRKPNGTNRDNFVQTNPAFAERKLFFISFKTATPRNGNKEIICQKSNSIFYIYIQYIQYIFTVSINL